MSIHDHQATISQPSICTVKYKVFNRITHHRQNESSIYLSAAGIWAPAHDYPDTYVCWTNVPCQIVPFEREKFALHRKYLRYIHITNTLLFTVLCAAKFHPSSTKTWLSHIEEYDEDRWPNWIPRYLCY